LVYVNYFDTLTETSSNLFSGVLNSDGNWYIDLSNAMDSEGNDFLDTYDTPDENVLLEIIVDGGVFGFWQTRQNSYQISPVSDIVLNVPNSVQDLDVEGSVVPIDITEVKGESTDIFAVLVDGLLEEACELNGLGSWTGSSCRCTSNAEYLTGPGICRCLSGYYSTGSSCVSSNTTVKTCLSCSPSCPSNYPLTSCPSESDCDPKTVTCTKQYSDGSGSCGTRTKTCYKVTSKELANPPCAFWSYCKCVTAYTDGTYSSTSSAFNCTVEKCGEAIANQAKTRLCTYALTEEELKEQESLKCSGGKSIGETTYFNGLCKRCEAVTSNGYYIAKWVNDSNLVYNGVDCDPEGGKLPTDPTDPCYGKEAGDSCEYPSGTNYYRGNGKLVCQETTEYAGGPHKCVLVGGSCTNTRSSNTTNREYFYDEVGACSITGDCLDGYIEIDERCQLDTGGVDSSSCKGKSIGDLCVMPESSQDGVVGSLVCSYSGSLTGDYNGRCVEVGSYCTEVSSLGREYVYDSDGECGIPGSCMEGFVEYPIKQTACEPEEESNYDDKYCWEGGGTYLFRSNGQTAEKCKNGEWVEARTAYQCQQLVNGAGDKCNSIYDICYNQLTNKIYYCSKENPSDPFSSFVYIPSVYNEPIGEVYALKLPVINAGEKCTGEEFEEGNEMCVCKNSYDIRVSKGEYCRHTNKNGCSDLAKQTNGVDIYKKVCKLTGETCGYSGHEFGCYGDVLDESSLGIELEENLLSLVSKVEAGEVSKDTVVKSQYILDLKTGMFSQIDEGSYIFEYRGEYYCFDVDSSNLIANNGSIMIYLDENSNQQYDEGEIEISDIASEISIVSVQKSFRYSLEEGLNFVSFPFLISSEDYRTAAGLLEKLNEVYGDAIYSISTFDSGRWKIVGENVKVYNNNDFQLLPGVGYMIKAKEDVEISIVGQPIQLETEDDSTPINLDEGWNLIGLYGSNIATYTAKTLLEGINGDDFTADNVTKWETDTQMYEGFQVSDGEEYGFDFILNILESYFVRITDGSGNWQPEISSND